MGKYSFVIIIAMALIWIVLTETADWSSLAIGLLVGAFCIFFSDRFLPPVDGGRVKFSKLIFYPIYIIGQVYLAGLTMIKFIIKGADYQMVPVKTTLKAEALRVMLMDSMTFVPGSVSVDLNDGIITSLWIFDKGTDLEKLGPDKVSELAKGGLEKKLARADVEAHEIAGQPRNDG
ncbi:MAG: Na+/H+ antiporter subunit E [Defluviitaleaceae bacterium]|nr:Na+/H+ antiporter subunit E [Defluviitaleaceae bacterium]